MNEFDCERYAMSIAWNFNREYVLIENKIRNGMG